MIMKYSCLSILCCTSSFLHFSCHYHPADVYSVAKKNDKHENMWQTVWNDSLIWSLFVRTQRGPPGLKWHVFSWQTAKGLIIGQFSLRMSFVSHSEEAFNHRYGMFDLVSEWDTAPHRKLQRKEGQRSADSDCCTDGRLSLEKQTLQNEELKWLI